MSLTQRSLTQAQTFGFSYVLVVFHYAISNSLLHIPYIPMKHSANAKFAVCTVFQTRV